MLYMVQFFETLEEATEFRKRHRGALYKDTPRSRSRDDYAVSRAILQESTPHPAEWYAARPYVVAWNETV